MGRAAISADVRKGAQEAVGGESGPVATLCGVVTVGHMETLALKAVPASMLNSSPAMNLLLFWHRGPRAISVFIHPARYPYIVSTLPRYMNLDSSRNSWLPARINCAAWRIRVWLRCSRWLTAKSSRFSRSGFPALTVRAEGALEMCNCMALRSSSRLPP